jgi:hypothetical protein
MMPVIEDLMLAVKGSALAWMVVKATAVLTIALVGTSLTRKSRAAVRHVFLTAAFGVLLAMPFASMVTPHHSHRGTDHSEGRRCLFLS